MYVVRDGVALGLDLGASGEAWGYSLAAGRVTWTASGLSWPHYFADLSGIGGSATSMGDIVVIAACKRLAPATGQPAIPGTSAGTGPASQPAGTASPSASSSPSPSATPSPPQACAAPVLVALAV